MDLGESGFVLSLFAHERSIDVMPSVPAVNQLGRSALSTTRTFFLTWLRHMTGKCLKQALNFRESYSGRSIAFGPSEVLIG